MSIALQLDRYLSVRRSLGYDLRTDERILRRFSRFADREGVAHIDTALFLRWDANLLHHGVDQAVIALWLGHENVETTQVYIHANMRLKEKALARVAALPTSSGRFRPDDQLLAFLEGL